MINTTYGYMEDFGTTATIGAASVMGVFDSATVAEFGILGSAPKFLCKASDVPGITFGQAVTIESVGYTVTEVKPDGTGLIELILDKAS